ncbi:MAG: Na(+)-translocating NADH-quinone reductase subunit C [Endozoicomonadaceae bacterium]|nr:Na(+)-translocating NADH-quinone reductase subunit C [Endozoicomonadaceae bacterium]MCY4330014.1 Na(+)-translocating NADH-quinone reductase subunit C [Endozoicomonadaceae bacterium]
MSDINNNSIKKILLVTIILCLLCSVLVASTAVFLNARQEENKQLDMEKSILEVSGLVENVNALSREEVFKLSAEKLIPALVDLRTGTFYKGSELNVNSYNFNDALKSNKLSRALPISEDPALIKRQEYYSKVFMVKNAQGQLSVLILPVRGYGLWSTLYGFLALKGDLKTVQALTFYSQKETPGLGGEVDNPRWKAQWHNKSIDLGKGKLGIQVVKTESSTDSEERSHQVDAISGATLTSRGVSHLINFWLGSQGFGPFLKNLKRGAI